MANRAVTTLVCANTYDGGFTVCVSTEGEVWFFGKEDDDRLRSDKLPQVIPSLVNVKAVDCGNNHVLCLDYDGNVFSFGKNSNGQLGYPTKEIKSTLIHKVDVPSCTHVSCGDDFSICLTETGLLYSFGNNHFGQLGHSSQQFPSKIKSLKNIDLVECGAFHVICRTSSNEIYSWGYNTKGQTSRKACNFIRKPTKCDDWPQDIVDIKCGATFTLVLTSTQEVYTCGDNYSGQLGRIVSNCSEKLEKIDALSEIRRIECGKYHALCIDNYDNLFVFGNNVYCQLGLGDAKNVPTPMQHPSLSNIIDISHGANHTLVKTSNNEIYAFGSNNYLQLGITTENVQQQTPLRVFRGKEDIWCTINRNSRAKSARK